MKQILIPITIIIFVFTGSASALTVNTAGKQIERFGNMILECKTNYGIAASDLGRELKDNVRLQRLVIRLKIEAKASKMKIKKLKATLKENKGSINNPQGALE